MSNGSSSVRRRRLFLVPISGYDDSHDDSNGKKFDEAIEEQAAAVERIWADLSLGHERAFTVVRPERLESSKDLEDFLHEQNFWRPITKEERRDGVPTPVTERDALVFYITGHGERFSDSHYLRMPNSRKGRRSTYFGTWNLLSLVLESEAEHILVMIDSCYSGTVAAEVRELLNSRMKDQNDPGTVLVMTSGVEDGKPRLRQFVRTLERVRNELFQDHEGVYERPWLTTEEFFSLMLKAYKKERAGEGDPANTFIVWPETKAVLQAAGDTTNFALPNPAYRPSLGRSDVALDPAWIDVVSGASTYRGGWSRPREQGWFFTDRNELLRPIVRFLISGEGALVVTGAAGSGKSALLGYAVAFSHYGFREDPAYRGPIGHAERQRLLPPAGAVNAAVRVGGRIRTLDEVAEGLLRQIEPSARRMPGKRMSERFLEAAGELVHETGRMVTVVIDGLDEADDPERVITDLVSPLLSLRGRDGEPGARLLLSVRSEKGEAEENDDGLLRHLLDATDRAERRLLRTDGPDKVRGHIERFALRVLSSEWSEGRQKSLLGLAEAIAEEVSPSFLDARVAAEQLNARLYPEDLPDPEDPEWRALLNEGTRGLMRRDIEATARTTRVRAETLVGTLRALAFAEGQGLPGEEVWPEVVEGLSARSISTAEATEAIRAVLGGRLVGYLIPGELDGRMVYGLIHARIAEMLREDPAGLFPGPAPVEWSVDVVETHRRFTVALSDPLSGDRRPHEYTRHFLIAHADKGGVLNDGLVPPSFLPMERSGQVRARLGLLREGVEENRALSAQASIEPWLDASDTESTRIDSLALALATDDLSTAVVARDLTPRWRDFTARGNALVHECQGGVRTATFWRTDKGGLRTAVGDDQGGVVVWDVHEGTVVGEPRLIPGGSAATALTMARHPKGSPYLFIGTRKGVWVHVPGKRRSDRRILDEQVSALVSARGKGAWLTVGAESGLVRYDPWEQMVDREPLGDPVHDLSLLDLPGGANPLLAVARTDRVEILEADTRNLVTMVRAQGRCSFDRVVLYMNEEGDLRLATVDREGDLRVWEALTGDLLRHHRGSAITSLTRYDRSGGGVLLGLGSADRSVGLWDPERGRSHRHFPRDHGRPATALVAVSDDGGPLGLVSGSPDGSLRLWNPQAGPAFWQSSSESGARLAFCVGEDGRSRVLSAGRGSAVQARSARDGTRLAPPALLDSFRLPRRITALYSFEHPDRGRLIVTGWPDGTIGFHDVTGREACSRIALSPGHATAFAAFESSGSRSLLMVGTSGGGVACCDPITGAYHYLRDEGPPVLDLAALRVPEVFLAAATEEGVRSWRSGEVETRMPEDWGPARSLAGFGESLAIGGADGAIRCWSPSSGALTELAGHRGPVAALAPLVIDGEAEALVSVGVDDTTVRVWDPRSGREIHRLVTGIRLTSLCLPTDGAGQGGRLIVFGGPSGAAAVSMPWRGR